VRIAEILGISESAVSNYMRGRVPDAETLIDIRNLTNCNLDWLLTGEGSMDAGPKAIDLNVVFGDFVREIIKQEQAGRRRPLLPDEVGPIKPASSGDFMFAQTLGTISDEEEHEEKEAPKRRKTG